MTYVYKDDGKTTYCIDVWKLTKDCTLPTCEGCLTACGTLLKLRRTGGIALPGECGSAAICARAGAGSWGMGKHIHRSPLGISELLMG